MCKETAPAPEAGRAAVVGAGTMGSGIAQVLVSSGFEVTIVDINPAALERACALAGARTGRVRGSTSISDVSGAEFVIEAVFEDLELKRRVFTELDRLSPSDKLLATNTSSLSVTAIAEVAAHPERIVGMHFMNPPPVMKLVEIVKGRFSSPEYVERAVALVRRLGKTPVVVEDKPAFLVNRLLMPLINEAARALDEGRVCQLASSAPADELVPGASAIDTAMRLGANLPMGPLHLADLIGIDVVVRELRELERALGDFYRPARALLERLERGELGRKTSRGFFIYGRANRD